MIYKIFKFLLNRYTFKTIIILKKNPDDFYIDKTEYN